MSTVPARDATNGRPLALVTGASSGIGLELARCCAEDGHALVIAADDDGIQQVGREMRTRGRGRILITGSIAGLMPGSYQAVYNGSKAFLDSFAYALGNELQDSGVSVTCLMPGPTDTRFFERADMLDTQVATGKKDDPASVARAGYRAMQKGKPGVVTGLQNKLQAGMTRMTSQPMLAQRHRRMAAPGTGVSQHGGGGVPKSVLMIGGVLLAALAIAAALQPGPRRQLLHASRQFGRRASDIGQRATELGQRAGSAVQQHVARIARNVEHTLH